MTISDDVLRELIYRDLKKDGFIKRTEEDILEIVDSVMNNPERKQFHVDIYSSKRG